MSQPNTAPRAVGVLALQGDTREHLAALREAGAEVVGVATVVDRETGAGDVIAAEGLEYRSLLGLGDLDLA